MPYATRVLFIALSLAAFPVFATTVASVTIESPSSYTVFQRDSGNGATIVVTGRLSGGVATSLEARATLVGNASGSPFDWTTIGSVPSGATSFQTSIRVSAGGWYQLEVRAVAEDTTGSSASVLVGVGEVFVTAGQSNASNCGVPPYQPTSGLVAVMTGTLDAGPGSFELASDPMPFPTLPTDPTVTSDGCTGGSPWSRLGEILAEELHVPIAFIMTAWGGTSVKEWQKGAVESHGQRNGFLYDRLSAAVRHFGQNGIRAVLWHQGESDHYENTSAALYRADLEALIAGIRADAGWTVPFGIARTSYMPFRHWCFTLQDPESCLLNETAGMAGIRAAQASVAAESGNFPGSDTDSFGPAERSPLDNIHLNGDGLLKHAVLWNEALRNAFPTVFGSVTDQSPVTPVDQTNYLPGQAGSLYGISQTGRIMNYVDSAYGGMDLGAAGKSLFLGVDGNGADELWLVDKDNGVWNYPLSTRRWTFTGAYALSIVPSTGGRAYIRSVDNSIWAYSPYSGWSFTGSYGVSLAVGIDPRGRDELWTRDLANSVWKYEAVGAGGSYVWILTHAYATQLVAGRGGMAFNRAVDDGIWAYTEETGWYFTGASGTAMATAIDSAGWTKLWVLDRKSGVWEYDYESAFQRYGWIWTGGYLTSLIPWSGGVSGLTTAGQVWTYSEGHGFGYRNADGQFPFYLLGQ